MDWNPHRPAIEIAADWIAATCVGSAAAFASWMLAPVGTGLIAAPVAGAMAAAGALFAMGRVDRRGRPSREQFVPVDFDDSEAMMLDATVDEDDALLLDDPLPALDEDSRVVQLFAVPAIAGGAARLPEPGEMAARIENFLGGTRANMQAEPASHGAPATPVVTDASAALHAALADIRRSLRQA